MKKFVVIDLETVPAPWWKELKRTTKKENAIKLLEAEAVGLTEDDIELVELPKFPPLPSHLPVVYGCWFVTLQKGKDMAYTKHTKGFMPGDVKAERAILQEIGDLIRMSNLVVTFNGRGFDMPLMQLRALANVVPWEFWEGKRHRYPIYRKPLGHVDLLDQLTDYGGATRFKLDYLANMINDVRPGTLAGKGEMDGSKVEEVMSQPGGLQKTIDYCNDDVKMTLQTFLRWWFTQGEATAADVQHWLNQLSDTPTPGNYFIYRYFREDMTETDVGPFESLAEAEGACLKHSNDGVITSGAFEVPSNYEMKNAVEAVVAK